MRLQMGAFGAVRFCREYRSRWLERLAIKLAPDKRESVGVSSFGSIEDAATDLSVKGHRSRTIILAISEGASARA